MLKRKNLALLALVASLFAAQVTAAAPEEIVGNVKVTNQAGIRYWLVKPVGGEVDRLVVLFTGEVGVIKTEDKGGRPTVNDPSFLMKLHREFVNDNQAVLLVDKPSDKAELRPAFRMSRDHANDLDKVLADALTKVKPRSIHLVGFHTGTMSVLNWAQRNPGKFASVAMVSGVFNESKDYEKWDEAKSRLMLVHHRADNCIPLKVFEPAVFKRFPALLLGEEGAQPVGKCAAPSPHEMTGSDAVVVAALRDWIANGRTPAGK